MNAVWNILAQLYCRFLLVELSRHVIVIVLIGKRSESSMTPYLVWDPVAALLEYLFVYFHSESAFSWDSQ